MTDGVRMADPIPSVRALPRGSAVILRHYGVPGRAAIARQLAAICRAQGLLLLVAGDARLAAAVGAAGVHLPEAMVPRAGRLVHEKRWRRWLVTASAHSPLSLRRAAAAADAVLLAPVFPTASHPLAPALGPLKFAALCRTSPIPVYALGGVTPATARRLKGSGLAGVAGIGLFKRGV